jgi:hypothetical protein
MPTPVLVDNDGLSRCPRLRLPKKIVGFTYQTTDGWQPLEHHEKCVAQRLRTGPQTRKLPIIALTARSDHARHQTDLDTRVDAYMVQTVFAPQ